VGGNQHVVVGGQRAEVGRDVGHRAGSAGRRGATLPQVGVLARRGAERKSGGGGGERRADAGDAGDADRAGDGREPLHRSDGGGVGGRAGAAARAANVGGEDSDPHERIDVGRSQQVGRAV